MDYKYKLSIIIPVYNIEQYLPDCLESILPQLTHNIEVIIINDCSTDLTAKICNSYRDRYENIKVIHNKVCQGVSIARNSGLKIAQGQYISFIDGDDMISSSYIQSILYCIDNYIFEMLMFDYSRELELIDNSLSPKEKVSEIESKEVFEGILNKGKYDGYLWNKIFCNDIIKKNDISFRKNISIWEDMLFVLQYIRECNKILIFNQKLYFYRLRIESATNSSLTLKQFQDKVEVCQQFLLLDKNINSSIYQQSKYHFSINKIDLLFYCLKNKLWVEIDNLDGVNLSSLNKKSKLKYRILTVFLFFKNLLR